MRSWVLWTRFSFRVSILCSIQVSLNHEQSSSLCRWKTPPQHDAATTMLHLWDGIGQVMSSSWFTPDMTLRNEVNQFNLGFIRPEKLQVGCHVSFTEERLPPVNTAIKPRSMECCRDGYPSGSFSYLHTGSLELSQSDHRVLGHLSYQAPPQIAKFGWVASSEKSWLFKTSLI